MKHRNIKIYFCNIIMKYLQHFFEATETRRTFACNIGVKFDILTLEQFAVRLHSRWGARGLHSSPSTAPSTPSSVLGDMQPARLAVEGSARPVL
jgi:hypothetical protein